LVRAIIHLDALSAFALHGVEASWLHDGDKRALRATFRAVLQSVRDGAAMANPPG
jgi:hypothetical protein